MIKDELQSVIKSVISGTLGDETVEVNLEHPANDKYGDYASNVLVKVKISSNQSKEGTESQVLTAIYKLIESGRLPLKKVEIVPPGFLNLYLSEQRLVQEVGEIIKVGGEYGRSSRLSGQKILIEFAHPNTHKEFHIGHLRNISLGESLVRLQAAVGAQIIRINYQGDVGLHVAKALWGIINSSKFKDQRAKLENEPLLERIKFLGRCYAEGHRAYEEGHADEIMAINKKIYARDPEIFELWKKTRRWSLEYFDSIYKRLGTHYDRLFFESEVAEPGTKIARQALARGILVESEGAVIFDGPIYGLDKRVFLTSAGLPTYEAKELGLAALEFSEFGEINGCLHVVGPEQQSFFKVTFKVEELLDPSRYSGKQRHLVYGYVQLKEGKMSSRRGNVVTALSVIEAAKQRVRSLLNLSTLGDLSDSEREEIAEKVAVGAVKYSLLKSEKSKPIIFDLSESVALAGNSGPYLQYTYARARSVLRKSSSFSCHPETFGAKDLDFAPEELSLLRTLYRFPEVVEAAAARYEPHLLCNFLFDLAQKFNQFYNNVSILTPGVDGLDSGSLERVTNFRLGLTAATAQILKNGLYLLGIGAPERM